MIPDRLPIERKIIIVVAVLFLNLILVSTGVVLENEKTMFQSVVGVVVAPFQIGFQKTVDYLSFEWRHYIFLKDSFEKYQELEKKYTELIYKNYLLKKSITDQEALKSMRSRQANFIKADVISVDMNFPLSSVLIDKGTRDGIKKDMIVLNGKGELVGKIVEPVSVFSSKVRLITSSIGGIGAYIDTNRLEGLLTGNNTALCNFKYLIENNPVDVGAEVITSGTDKIFPPYIPIGKVVNVQKDNFTQKIRIEPFFIKNSIKQLFVIQNYLPPISSYQYMNSDLPPSLIHNRSFIPDNS
ncbi:MAG: rod shape-determining protein MreC [Candidatus Omnitrophota bacterium]